MLIAKGIHKSYGSLEVLKGVDLEISKGEIVSIVGASGAGKSTLLHILGTLDRPDQGKLSFHEQNLMLLKGDSLAEFRNAKIGFVFQFHNLLPEFTALENICIPGFIQGKEEKALKKRAEELGEILGIRHRLDHKPSELSGGEQQRVSVARALINNPDFIFADEPSGNLDTSNAKALHDLFFKLRDTFQLSFVIVTHNEDLADMADRKVVMKDGRIVDA
ncbi:MAG: ABC transporter ATP-binding protein [Algoriphagus sp.]|jgi:lipoprotein-releasing system ATP-binding protein|uniref:ABC transporter ATP-binding protein n=4 Tax=Algoriphagus sp. TaxID=1872435 RepID=UPI002756DAF8|nr:ABC transporter ATP-binding protein [Algoriphagus sp.]MDP4749010.1 ABC transporter ATP-binding protein [Algoriphagus sp.]MDP4838926.1 ABC transporter ATP-binding protein [Algoriphagus sp.]MDP4905477.1 ABC transporter ATP-binding protein [Algoriphagus sp.]MDP4956173.1 ABC transporter ATP-binding protein [Algoriphagus sp.]